MSKYITPPTLSTNFSESGKSAKKRFENILNMKAKKTGVLLFLLILVLVGIVSSMVACNNTDDKLNLAKKYVTDNGYKIVSDGKFSDKYILTNENLVVMPYSMYWRFFEFDEIDRCIDKEIFVCQFTVENHPLDNAENNNKKQTLVSVIICDNQVVGGYSLPDYLEPVLGGVYSFDGKTLEKVKGMDYLSWADLWVEKYGSADNPKDRPNLYYTMPHYSSMPVKALISSNSWGLVQYSYPSSTERQYDEYLSIRPNSPDIPVWLNLKCEDEKISAPQILEAYVYLTSNTRKEISVKIIDNFINFMPPKKVGEYIYSVVIKFEKGTVSYDMKIVVEDGIRE